MPGDSSDQGVTGQWKIAIKESSDDAISNDNDRLRLARLSTVAESGTRPNWSSA